MTVKWEISTRRGVEKVKDEVSQKQTSTNNCDNVIRFRN